MSSRDSHNAENQGVGLRSALPSALGLCPVHAEEFYLPLTLPLDAPFIGCPEPGCSKYLALYVPAGESR